jgi:predicted small lipoprotein YifL
MTDHSCGIGPRLLPPIASLTLIAALVAACGQTGPLTLEGRSAERTAIGAATPAEAADADDESDSGTNER